MARFERSILPEHKGTRAVVLRFLKIITPVKCVIPLYKGNIVQPEEGELRRFPRFRRNPIDQRAWSINIDKEGQMAQGLRSHSLFEVVAHKKLDPGIILINQKVLQCEVFRLLTYYI